MCGPRPWQVSASRCPRVCLWRARGSVKLDPHGVPSLVGTCPRVRPWLTRGYRRFDPNGVAGLAVWFGGVVAVPPHGISSPAGGWQGACRAALCAIWQTVKADTHGCLRFSVGKAAGWGARGHPSHRFPFPSHGSADPSHGIFDPRPLSSGFWGVDLCHIASFFRVLGTSVAEHRRDVSENELFLIFAYLRATEQSCENNRFCVLKTRAADNQTGPRRAEKRPRQV